VPAVDAELSNRIGEADERFVPGTADGSLMEAEHLVRYWWATGLAEGRRVLDAGCGVGYGSAMLAGAGAAEVVGIDVAAGAVEAASAAAPANATFAVADVHALPFEDARFDLVVCFEVIEHVERQDEVIAELARVLAPGGVLAVSSPNRDVYPSGNPHHVHEYVPEELRAALAERFPHVELRRQHDWVASAVLDDEQAADAALASRPELALAKVFSAAPGSETYTIALAGREPLPRLPGRVLMGGLLRFQPLVQALERDVAALQDIEARLRADNATLLGAIEEELAARRRLEASVSWRITRPLRALRR
jgi:SAM-dependent methyltransferase